MMAIWRPDGSQNTEMWGDLASLADCDLCRCAPGPGPGGAASCRAKLSWSSSFPGMGAESPRLKIWTWRLSRPSRPRSTCATARLNSAALLSLNHAEHAGAPELRTARTFDQAAGPSVTHFDPNPSEGLHAQTVKSRGLSDSCKRPKIDEPQSEGCIHDHFSSAPPPPPEAPWPNKPAQDSSAQSSLPIWRT